jgi:hypothetical protein
VTIDLAAPRESFNSQTGVLYMATVDELRVVKRKYSANLLRQPGVCGVDINIKKSGEANLTVHLDSRDPEIRATLPSVLDGFPVEYVYTGPIRKQGEKSDADQSA